jgi:hypothetical protein
VALLPVASQRRRPTSLPRLLAETFGTTLAVIGRVWSAWIVLRVLARAGRCPIDRGLLG